MFEELSDSIRESEKVPDDGSGGAKDSPANTADGPPVAQESNALQRAKVTSGNIRPVPDVDGDIGISPSSPLSHDDGKVTQDQSANLNISEVPGDTGKSSSSRGNEETSKYVTLVEVCSCLRKSEHEELYARLCTDDRLNKKILQEIRKSFEKFQELTSPMQKVRLIELVQQAKCDSNVTIANGDLQK